jgi:hypothetical protein
MISSRRLDITRESDRFPAAPRQTHTLIWRTGILDAAPVKWILLGLAQDAFGDDRDIPQRQRVPEA